MSIQALNLGLPKVSLVANIKGRELFYHLRLVPEGSHKELAELEMAKIVDTDDCKIYRANRLIATTSTQELERLMLLATNKTMTMVEVHTNEGMYYAAIHEDLVKPEYVGVLTNTDGRTASFVQSVNGTFWANNGTRLIQLEDEEHPETELKKFTAQEAIMYINKNQYKFKGLKDQLILF